MEITETRVSVVNSPNSRLRAYASITLDGVFVVRDIRIIEGKKGLFVAMPSKKTQKPCARCGFKNPTTNRFCGSCGSVLPPVNNQKSEATERHRDLAHPISPEFREYMQKKIIETYQQVKTQTEQSSSGQ